MVIYRKATINDADNLAKIRSIFLLEANDVHSETEREKMETANKIYFETALADDSFAAWLALDDDKIIATSGLSFSVVPPSFRCPDGRVAYIMNMFTFPDYRKQDIGSELFKRIVEEAKNRGYKKITLNATDMGRPLYEKYGFKDEKGDMAFYIK
ncbi:MAG: GNAT family N-acetyltransferase [Oscillospiraceae bacterium]|nr:GNAT family N-acetyltransferase [Oscillospiraceae bacterium]